MLFVPAGTLHAIGEGILMVELQEPTDLSVLLEWRRFGVDEASANLQLGWPRVLHALDLGRAWIDQLVVRDGLEVGLEAVVDMLPGRARPYFRGQWITLGRDAVSSEPSFAVLVVLTGSLEVSTNHGETLELSGGDTVLVPYGAGCTKLEGSGEVIRCLPPASDAGVENGEPDKHRGRNDRAGRAAACLRAPSCDAPSELVIVGWRQASVGNGASHQTRKLLDLKRLVGAIARP